MDYMDNCIHIVYSFQSGNLELERNIDIGYGGRNNSDLW